VFTIPEFLAARKPGTFKPLRCPHCQKLLNPLAPIVLATHNCPHCGRQVLAEPEAANDAPALALSQLDDAHAAFTRFQSRVLRFVLVAFLAWFGVVVVTALFADTLRAALGLQDAAGWVIVAATLILTATGTTVGLRAAERGKRAAPLCPHCAASLYQHADLTRLTGNCFACGRRVADVPPDEPTGPLPTVDEYKAAERRANRSIGAALFLGAILVAIPVGISTLVRHDWLATALEPRYGEPAAAVIASSLLLGWVVALVAVAGGVMWFATRRQRKRREADPVLRCRRCDSELGVIFQAVATQRCPKCRARVLADPEPVGVADEPAGG
jgi:hypothetical protein